MQSAHGELRCKRERITHLVKIILAPFGVEDGRIVTIVAEMAGSYQSITSLKLSEKPPLTSNSRTYRCFLGRRQQGSCDRCRGVEDDKLVASVSEACRPGALAPRAQCSSSRSPTSLRDGETSQLHQLVDRECTGAHELLVESSSSLGSEGLSRSAHKLQEWCPVAYLDRHNVFESLGFCNKATMFHGGLSSRKDANCSNDAKVKVTWNVVNGGRSGSSGD